MLLYIEMLFQNLNSASKIPIRTYDEIVSANANEMQVSGTFQCTYKGRVGIDTF